MNPQDRAYKRLMKDSREYLSDIVKKYNRANTEKEKALRVLLTYRHFCGVAARLCMLHEDFKNEKLEEGR